MAATQVMQVAPLPRNLPAPPIIQAVQNQVLHPQSPLAVLLHHPARRQSQAVLSRKILNLKIQVIFRVILHKIPVALKTSNNLLFKIL